jgi:hypothetical protein
MTETRTTMAMKPRRNILAWAVELPIEVLEEMAVAVCDVRDLERQWLLLASDLEVGNAADAANAVYAEAIRSNARRLCRLVSPGFSRPDVLPRAEDVRNLWDAICRMRAAVGLASPALRPARQPERWWEQGAGDGEGFKFLREVPGRVDRGRFGVITTAWPARWKVDVDRWEFDVADDGTVVKATRK